MKLKRTEKELLCQIINDGGMWVSNEERNEFLNALKKSGMIVHGGAISTDNNAQYFYMD